MSDRVCQALLNNDQAADAEPVLRECLAIREKALVNAERWFRNTEKTRRLLGECLTRQGADPSLALGARTDESARIEKLREAETILVELANATLDDDTSSEDDKTKAIQRVVDLYEAWHAAESGKGYDSKADEWRASIDVEDVMQVTCTEAFSAHRSAIGPNCRSLRGLADAHGPQQPRRCHQEVGAAQTPGSPPASAGRPIAGLVWTLLETVGVTAATASRDATARTGATCSWSLVTRYCLPFAA